ncbi:ABC transporter ATP-binding protein [Cytobacillus depressus]|uniref:ABC transporter ATP-binding protein n=1 Tax=Cytobacillus depressus TaxID=1602942 RepID=A0A6L3V0B4_9BACI|nr:ABC transporter ATP-binding protein [Cytobacillus depressus]KAB2330480.1 ABC transporter ATP-binding protein [Cytobacillus depressus]
MLNVRNLHTYHGHIHVLKGISFHVNKGEMLAIIGGNGAGKSTLLGTLTGIYQPRQGEIHLENKNITNILIEETVHQGMVLVPERRQIFDALTVYENLMLGAFHRYRKDKKQLKNDAEEVLEIFPRLKEMLTRLGGNLSGGEQQMLAIGRGLMAKPKIMLLDEPSLGLAPIIVQDIMEVLANLRKSTDTTIILVEQNAKAAMKVSDRTCVIERGQIALNGNSKEMLEDSRVASLYLGGNSTDFKAIKEEIFLEQL